MEKDFDTVKPNYDEAKKCTYNKTNSYFDGKFIEYIGYKFLAFLITLFSLTIAKPWADILILDYKFKHTVYNGKRLKFEGKGSALFVQRFKWYLLTIITVGIYALWIPIKKEKWIVSNLHFEDENLTTGESYFDGKLLGLLGVNLFTYLLILLSFGLLFPFAICYKQKWIVKHTIINCKKLVFSGKAISIILHYLLWWILSIITLGIYGLWLPIKFYGWQVKNTHIKLKEESYDNDSIIPIIIGIVLTLLLIVCLIIFIPKLEISKIISGDKKISELFPKKGSAVNKGEINFSLEGRITSEDECPSGYSYSSYNKYCVATYPDSSEKKCNKLKGQFNSEFNECVVIILKPSTVVNTTSCVNDWNENDSFNRCYKTVSVQSFDECKTKKSIGYFYGFNEDKWCTVSVSNENLISQTNSNTDTSKKEVPIKKETNNVQSEEPVSKCNSGYVFNSFDNMCYSLTDYIEPITTCTDDYAACGVSCPDDNYELSWETDIGLEGYCYKTVNPNY